ncbi:MAG: hypothetical protein WBM02_10785 [bacterium]
MKPEDRLRHAIQTKDYMSAYEIFLEEAVSLSYKVSPILKYTAEKAEDWVRDQLLDLACNHLLSIRKPEAWKSYIHMVVVNQAKSQIRGLQPTILSFNPMQDMKELELEIQDEPCIIKKSESLRLFYTFPLRERAVLKLAYCISPNIAEWKGLAIATGKDAVQLEQYFCKWFFESNIIDTRQESKITETYMKTIQLQNKQKWLKQKLDETFLLNPPDPDAEESLLDKLESCTAALNRQNKRYLKLQQPVPKRIPVAKIAQGTGLSENIIYQIISRSRKKIKEVLL